MTVALFVSMQRSQSVMFGLVAKELAAEKDGVQALIISGDAWNELDAEESLRRLGVDFERLARPVPGPNLRSTKGSLQAMHLLDVARSEVRALLHRVRPQIVVVGADIAGIEHLFVQHACDLHIPTLLVQDGALLDVAFDSTVRWLGAYEYGCGGCTHIAVTGDFDRQVMELRGVDPDKITVTGQPRYDLLVAPTEQDVVFGDLLPEALSRSRLVLFASQPAFVYAAAGLDVPVPELDLAWQVVAACEPFIGERLLVVKLHPREALETYEPLLASLNENLRSRVHITRDADIYALLRHSDLVIVPGSTVAQEAILLQKPVVALSYAVPGGRSYLSGDPAVLEVQDAASLARAVQDALQDEPTRRHLTEGREDFVARRLHRADGQSAERVAELVSALTATPALRRKAAASHALVPLRLNEACVALEQADVEQARAKLVSALRRDARLLEMPHLVAQQFLSRAFLIGEGCYGAAPALAFARAASDLLGSFGEPVLRTAGREIAAQVYWAAAREIGPKQRWQAMRFLWQAATSDPSYLVNRGFLRSAADIMAGEQQIPAHQVAS